MCFFLEILWYFWTQQVLLQRWYLTCHYVHTLTPEYILKSWKKKQYLMNPLYLPLERTPKTYRFEPSWKVLRTYVTTEGVKEKLVIYWKMLRIAIGFIEFQNCKLKQIDHWLYISKFHTYRNRTIISQRFWYLQLPMPKTSTPIGVLEV